MNHQNYIFASPLHLFADHICYLHFIIIVIIPIFQQASAKRPSGRCGLHATCSLLLLFLVLCSLTPLLQVIVAAFEEERVPSLFPLSLPEWCAAPSRTNHWLSSSEEVPCCHQATHNKHSPPSAALLRCSQLNGECRCLEASCVKLPHSGQRHGGTVGARLF